MMGVAARVAETPRTPAEKLALVVAFGFAFGYAISLAMLFLRHLWILDAQGQPILADFVVFWASGKLALNGAPLAVYDAYRLHAAEAATIGRDFGGWLVWPYPPLFLLVVAPLANLSYGLAFIVWVVATLTLYAVVTAIIVGRRLAWIGACAMPWVLRTLLIGQNGLLTSSIIGIVLLNLEKRPIVAGLCLGLLSYKPQFGILFPLALAAGGYWRAFTWAALGTCAWNGLAVAIFGPAAFDAFLQGLLVKTNTDLVHNALGWDKLQSFYGLSRFAGLPSQAAWAVQGIASASLALAVAFCWRSRAPFPLKASLLASSAALATPFIFVDDLPVLAVALAFLFRDRMLDRVEATLLILAAPCVYLSVGLPVPLGIFASLALVAIVARRLYAFSPRTRIRPSWVTEATSLPSAE